jgi:hypothetical protein
VLSTAKRPRISSQNFGASLAIAASVHLRPSSIHDLRLNFRHVSDEFFRHGVQVAWDGS